MWFGVGNLLNNLFVEKTHQQASNWDPYLVFELWQGNAVEAFKTVVQQNILNESWLALSPMSTTALKCFETIANNS